MNSWRLSSSLFDLTETPKFYVFFEALQDFSELRQYFRNSLKSHGRIREVSHSIGFWPLGATPPKSRAPRISEMHSWKWGFCFFAGFKFCAQSLVLFLMFLWRLLISTYVKQGSHFYRSKGIPNMRLGPLSIWVWPNEFFTSLRLTRDLHITVFFIFILNEKVFKYFHFGENILDRLGNMVIDFQIFSGNWKKNEGENRFRIKKY